MARCGSMIILEYGPAHGSPNDLDSYGLYVTPRYSHGPSRMSELHTCTFDCGGPKTYPKDKASAELWFV